MINIQRQGNVIQTFIERGGVFRTIEYPLS